MARHRSPSGAEAADPDRTTRLRVTAIPEVRRLPPPPAASTHGRATVAAVAAGAVVAAGQTLAGAFLPAGPPPITSALLPIASVADLAAPAAADPTADPQRAIDAIGGDQLRIDGIPDPGAALDIESLIKGATIAEQAARQTKIINAALAGGAAEAHVINGEAFVRPVLGRLSSLFGARWGTTHYGIDIANAIGTPIYALTDGVVEEAGPASGFGLWVVLRHPDGTRSVYGHVNRMFVEVDQQVRAGQQIAEVGNRGWSTGPHLHLEIWDADGNKLNPIPWLLAHGIAFPS
ncbi:MAG: M23 family metallopeptidase [Pseudonocardia sp.]|nr:M23 family metallopeptidase [Pseudonocardia sp.]